MPRYRRQEYQEEADYPVSAAEVAEMFKNAKRRPPWPSKETDQGLAEYLSHLTQEGFRRRGRVSPQLSFTDAQVRYFVQFQNAVKVLRQVDRNQGSFIGLIPNRLLAEVIRNLDALETALGAKPDTYPAHLKAWAGIAIACVFTIAEILKEECGADGGVSKNSVAVKFTQQAFERIGWRDPHGRPITAGAIAAYCSMPSYEDREGQKRTEDVSGVLADCSKGQISHR